MEIQRPPYGRVFLLLVAAVLSLSYAWDTFTAAAAGAGSCWAFPFRVAFVCKVPLLGFVLAVVAIVAAMATVFVALTTLRTEEARVPRRTKTILPPKTESPGWADVDRRLSIKINDTTVNASNIEELRTKLKSESGLPDEEIERVLRMFEGAMKP